MKNRKKALHPLAAHLLGVETKHHPHGQTLDEEEMQEGDMDLGPGDELPEESYMIAYNGKPDPF